MLVILMSGERKKAVAAGWSLSRPASIVCFCQFAPAWHAASAINLSVHLRAVENRLLSIPRQIGPETNRLRIVYWAKFEQYVSPACGTARHTTDGTRARRYEICFCFLVWSRRASWDTFEKLAQLAAGSPRATGSGADADQAQISFD